MTSKVLKKKKESFRDTEVCEQKYRDSASKLADYIEQHADRFVQMITRKKEQEV